MLTFPEKTNFVTVSPTTSNSYSTTLSMYRGYFRVSISGTWTGQVNVESSDDGTNFNIVDSYTANFQGYGYEPVEGILYRIGMPASTNPTGTAVCRLTTIKEDPTHNS